MLTRTDILNHLVSRYGYRRYLEIGVGDGANFEHVQAEIKHGVDPSSRGGPSYQATSDEFFDAVAPKQDPYDLVFVDGLHTMEQALRDVENALQVLAPGGIIVMHDIDPPDEGTQSRERADRIAWTGDVWKAFAKLRMTRADLAMATVDTDWGVGLIARGKQELFPTVPDGALTYDFFVEHRRRLLNLVPPERLAPVAHALVTHGRPLPPRLGRYRFAPLLRTAHRIRGRLSRR